MLVAPAQNINAGRWLDARYSSRRPCAGLLDSCGIDELLGEHDGAGHQIDIIADAIISGARQRSDQGRLGCHAKLARPRPTTAQQSR